MKALIIGGGVAADIHARVLIGLGVDIACFCDLNINAGKTLAEKYNTLATDDIEKALKMDFDFGVVCTPSGTHPSLAVKVMEAGRHVVVEKPLGLDPESCRLVAETEKKTGKICAPISQLRFSDTYRRVKACLEREELGKLVTCSLSMKYHRSPEYYRGTWKGTKSMDGGELMNQGIHGVDTMLGYLGKVKTVSGKVCTRFHDIEAEDTAVAHIVFEDGTLATLDSSTALGYPCPRRLEICGTKGMIVVEEDRVVFSSIEGLDIHSESNTNGNNDPANIGTDLHSLIYKNILAAFEGKEKLEYGVGDALNTIELICAIYESSETSKAVEL